MSLRTKGKAKQVKKVKVSQNLILPPDFSDSLVAVMQDAILVIDSKNVILSVNPAFCRMTGFSADNLIGSTPPYPYWPPEEHEKIQREFDSSRGDQVVTGHLILMRKNGERFPALVRPSVIKDSTGKSRKYLTIVQDLTEFLRAKGALQESEERFRTLLELTQEVIYVHSNGILKYLNRAALDFFGASSLQDLLGKPIIDRVHPEFRERALLRIKMLMNAGGNAPLMTLKFLKLDASVVEGEAHSTKIIYEGVASVLTSIREVTERRKLEVEREQYFRFFKRSSDLMCLAGLQGAFKKVNPAFIETLGYSEVELLSKPFMDFIHPEDKASTQAEIERQLEHGFTYDFENRYICKDGSYKWLSWRASFDKHEGLTYASARDITQRKQAESELLAAKDAAENASKLQAKFLDVAAHELRTPVTSFSLLIEFTQRQLAKGHPVTEVVLLRLQRAADRLRQLAIDLLDVSRLQRGLVSLRLERCNVLSLFSECLEDFRFLAPERNFQLSVPKVPVEVEVDPVRICQVLSNLIDNAVKYTSPETSIEVKVEELPTLVRVSVIDHGAGIPKVQQENIFMAFSRGTSDATLSASGLGLGLAVCRGIVALHGGTITLKSDVGQGSTFSFELPRKGSVP